MRNALRLGALAVGILCGAFGTTSNAAPATVTTDYCRTDTGGMRGCGFASLEKCQEMASGRGGTCAPNPFPVVSNSFASVVMGPAGRSRHSRH